MDIATILSLIEWSVEEEPRLADSIRKIFSKPKPTSADWQAERDTVKSMDYDKIVTNSQLPPEQPT
jgi:hypothetical protein